MKPILQSVFQPVLRNLSDPAVGGKSILSRLFDPASPLPSFVEGWALNSFNGVSNSAPSGSPVTYLVTGSKASSTLSIEAGTEKSGSWGAVITHDDGSFGLYTIHSMTGGACGCWPPLLEAVTSGAMATLGASQNGQHYTEDGYRALGRRIYSATLGESYRSRFASKWDPTTGAKDDWAAVGGLGPTQFNVGVANGFIGNGVLMHSWRARGNMALNATPTAPYTGKGVQRSFELGGASGTLEMFVSCSNASPSASPAFASMRVVVTIDGDTAFDQTYDSNSGLVRVLVPYDSANTGVVRVTRAGEEALSYSIRIGTVTWWAYDRDTDWADKVISKGDNVVLLGDSWSAFYDGSLGDEIQKQMAADGGSGTVTTVATGGYTAAQGLARFDSDVAPLSPDVVVIEFFVNDYNAYGVDGYAEWVNNLYRIGVKAQEIGARPVFVMPLPTASISQAQNLGRWSEKIGVGMPVV